MFSNFEILIALRYLRSKKKQAIVSVIALFSLIGVALGVAALIVVMAVMNGFHKEISAKMTGFNGDIIVRGIDGYISDYEEVTNKIKTKAEVVFASPAIEGQVMATSHGYNYGALVKGVKLSDLQDKHLVSDHLLQGDISSIDNENNLIIGYELANNLHLNNEQKITLISPSGTSTVLGMVPRVKTFNIGALFKTDMYAYDAGTIFMNLKMAQTYFRMPGKVNLIEVMIKEPHKSEKTVAEIKKILGTNFEVSDWKTINEVYFNVLKTERVVMFLILTLIIIVAAFNIISSLIMLVNDKAKDIAILRTMGASRRSIMKIFFLCGSVVGLTGTALGIFLGLSFALNIESIRIFLEKLTGSTIFDPIIYYLSALPSDVQTIDVLSVASIATSLALLATIYPAKKAANMQPIEGLRYE